MLTEKYCIGTRVTTPCSRNIGAPLIFHHPPEAMYHLPRHLHQPSLTTQIPRPIPSPHGTALGMTTKTTILMFIHPNIYLWLYPLMTRWFFTHPRLHRFQVPTLVLSHRRIELPFRVSSFLSYSFFLSRCISTPSSLFKCICTSIASLSPTLLWALAHPLIPSFSHPPIPLLWSLY